MHHKTNLVSHLNVIFFSDAKNVQVLDHASNEPITLSNWMDTHKTQIGKLQWRDVFKCQKVLAYKILAPLAKTHYVISSFDSEISKTI